MSLTAKTLGAQLREIRQGLGLSLGQVQDKSDGRWKAVVIGSYERGDRSITAVKLDELLRWYGAGDHLAIVRTGQAVIPVGGTGAGQHIEYAVAYGDGRLITCDSEDEAVTLAAVVAGATVVSRVVAAGEWDHRG